MGIPRLQVHGVLYLAAALGITAGTLTSAVNLLEKKGYLLRRRDERDKRVVHLLPTERGRAADARHRDFHRQMVAHVLDGLTDEEAECTLRALGRVAEFFRRGAPERGRTRPTSQRWERGSL